MLGYRGLFTPFPHCKVAGQEKLLNKFDPTQNFLALEQNGNTVMATAWEPPAGYTGKPML